MYDCNIQICIKNFQLETIVKVLKQAGAVRNTKPQQSYNVFLKVHWVLI